MLYVAYRAHELYSTDVSRVRYISPYTLSGSTNGFLYHIYIPPYFRVTDNSEVEWKICNKLHDNILGYMRNNSSWLETGPYSVISEKQENGYSAYIKTGNTLIFIRGFPDFGGRAPSEDEKSVCAG